MLQIIISYFCNDIMFKEVSLYIYSTYAMFQVHWLESQDKFETFVWLEKLSV